MSNYRDEGRYNVGTQFPTTKPGLNPNQVFQVSDGLSAAPKRELDYDPLGASQDNYPLGAADFHKFTSGGAAASITGFGNQRVGLQIITNADGTGDLTLEHENASSTAANRIHCHTLLDIVLGPDESALIRYDYNLLRWRTIGFT